ncbi:MAG: acylphosphatase [Verrucomicrobiales bacterium]|jgi:acylphosphatase
MIAKEVHFEGRVQGVGFRYATRQLAKGFDVTGWVKNLFDGRVEMQVMGEDEEVDEFIQEIRDSSLAHHIQKVEIRNIPDLEGIKGFSIR